MARRIAPATGGPSGITARHRASGGLSSAAPDRSKDTHDADADAGAAGAVDCTSAEVSASVLRSDCVIRKRRSEAPNGWLQNKKTPRWVRSLRIFFGCPESKQTGLADRHATENASKELSVSRMQTKNFGGN
jgi:hypothetical protein